MAFSDTDPIEQLMGVRCEDMSPNELVTYIKTYQEAFGRKMAVEGFIERAVFKGMHRIYSPATAGQIVKWVFYRYHGVWDGSVVTFTSFAKGRKWWVDKMHQEMQAHVAREVPEVVGAVAAGIGARKLSEL